MNKIVKLIAWVLVVVVGGLNWGLYGVFNLDLVATVLGSGTILAKAAYIVVGLSAVALIVDKAMKGMKMKK